MSKDSKLQNVNKNFIKNMRLWGLQHDVDGGFAKTTKVFNDEFLEEMVQKDRKRRKFEFRL